MTGTTSTNRQIGTDMNEQEVSERIVLEKQHAEELRRNAETMDQLRRSDYEYAAARNREWEQNRRINDAKWRVYGIIVIIACSVLGFLIGQMTKGWFR
jgi:t-SNARE complex subunit (syntaxin)